MSRIIKGKNFHILERRDDGRNRIVETKDIGLRIGLKKNWRGPRNPKAIGLNIAEGYYRIKKYSEREEHHN